MYDFSFIPVADVLRFSRVQWSIFWTLQRVTLFQIFIFTKTCQWVVTIPTTFNLMLCSISHKMGTNLKFMSERLSLRGLFDIAAIIYELFHLKYDEKFTDRNQISYKLHEQLYLIKRMPTLHSLSCCTTLSILWVSVRFLDCGVMRMLSHVPSGTLTGVYLSRLLRLRPALGTAHLILL